MVAVEVSGETSTREQRTAKIVSGACMASTARRFGGLREHDRANSRVESLLATKASLFEHLRLYQLTLCVHDDSLPGRVRARRSMPVSNEFELD